MALIVSAAANPLGSLPLSKITTEALNDVGRQAGPLSTPNTKCCGMPFKIVVKELPFGQGIQCKSVDVCSARKLCCVHIVNIEISKGIPGTELVPP